MESYSPGWPGDLPTPGWPGDLSSEIVWREAEKIEDKEQDSNVRGAV